MLLKICFRLIWAVCFYWVSDCYDSFTFRNIKEKQSDGEMCRQNLFQAASYIFKIYKVYVLLLHTSNAINRQSIMATPYSLL